MKFCTDLFDSFLPNVLNVEGYSPDLGFVAENISELSADDDVIGGGVMLPLPLLSTNSSSFGVIFLERL